MRTRSGWTLWQYHQIRRIQEEIKNENIRISNENWETKINKMNIDYKKPNLFWRDVEKMMGGGEDKITYIFDDNRSKIFETEKKNKFLELYRLMYLRLVMKKTEILTKIMKDLCYNICNKTTIA